jgi:hypothetical protein
MVIHFEDWIAFFVLAGLVGFFADRTSVCTVKAVQEIFTTRRAFMLLSFAKIVLWVTGVTIWLVWWIAAAHPAPLSFGITWAGIFGGVLFGIGAVCNGGCALSTLTRLGNGNLGMLVTLSGFAVGVTILVLIRFSVDGIAIVPTAPLFELNFVTATVLGLALTLWMTWELVRLWRMAPSGRWSTLLLSPRFRLSTAAAVIGVSNGILYAYLGTWSYTHTLRSSVELMIVPADVGAGQVSAAMLWWLFFALVVGVIVSSVLSRRFVLDWRALAGWQGFLSGGILMGLGAALVPGGNDVLLLNAIPGLSPHALPAYLAMLAGIAIALMVVKWRGGEWEVINCSADQCQEFKGSQ